MNRPIFFLGGGGHSVKKMNVNLVFEWRRKIDEFWGCEKGDLRDVCDIPVLSNSDECDDDAKKDDIE